MLQRGARQTHGAGRPRDIQGHPEARRYRPRYGDHAKERGQSNVVRRTQDQRGGVAQVRRDVADPTQVGYGKWPADLPNIFPEERVDLYLRRPIGGGDEQKTDDKPTDLTVTFEATNTETKQVVRKVLQIKAPPSEAGGADDEDADSDESSEWEEDSDDDAFVRTGKPILMNVRFDMMLHQAAAKQQIIQQSFTAMQDLYQGEVPDNARAYLEKKKAKTKQTVTKLALDYSLLSEYTSFIAKATPNKAYKPPSSKPPEPIPRKQTQQIAMGLPKTLSRGVPPIAPKSGAKKSRTVTSRSQTKERSAIRVNTNLTPRILQPLNCRRLKISKQSWKYNESKGKFETVTGKDGYGVCPSGHACEIAIAYELDEAWCDVCEREKPQGKRVGDGTGEEWTLYGCRVCDWDMCDAAPNHCAKQEPARKRAQAAREAARKRLAKRSEALRIRAPQGLKWTLVQMMRTDGKFIGTMSDRDTKKYLTKEFRSLTAGLSTEQKESALALYILFTALRRDASLRLIRRKGLRWFNANKGSAPNAQTFTEKLQLLVP